MADGLRHVNKENEKTFHPRLMAQICHIYAEYAGCG